MVLFNKTKSVAEHEIFTLIQPDISMICDEAKLADGKKCLGAPDIIIEILSLGNTEKQMNLKIDLHEEAGVSGYQMVSPVDKTVLVDELIEGKYAGLKPFSDSQILSSHLFSEVKIDLKKN